MRRRPTARRTRGQSSAVHMPPMFHGKQGASIAPNRIRHCCNPSFSIRPESGGGLLLLDHMAPLTRRHVCTLTPALRLYDEASQPAPRSERAVRREVRFPARIWQRQEMLQRDRSRVVFP